VIAHADRYNPTNIEMLVDNGARIQLNADSLDRLFMKKTFSRWLEKGIVIALGSDIHGNDKLAYQHFVKAQAKIGRSLLYVKRESDKIFDSAKEI
jgi:tyrosine-protein phosphatase YwqE